MAKLFEVTAIQGDLFEERGPRSPSSLRDTLKTSAGHEVDLTLTRNRSHMVSLELPHPDAPVRLRLHEAFLQAPEEVIQSLGNYLKRHRRKDWRVVTDFAQTIPGRGPGARSLPRLQAKGEVYDLAAIRDRVSRQYFQSRLRCRIGWAPYRPRSPRKSRKRRSIRYGSYHQDTDTVRIHPLLDSRQVPERFVEYIIYHEMLHAVVPPVKKNGRWLYHPPAFKHLERRFPDWDAMQKLARALLDWIPT